MIPMLYSKEEDDDAYTKFTLDPSIFGGCHKVFYWMIRCKSNQSELRLHIDKQVLVICQQENIRR